MTKHLLGELRALSLDYAVSLNGRRLDAYRVKYEHSGSGSYELLGHIEYEDAGTARGRMAQLVQRMAERTLGRNRSLIRASDLPEVPIEEVLGRRGVNYGVVESDELRLVLSARHQYGMALPKAHAVGLCDGPSRGLELHGKGIDSSEQAADGPARELFSGCLLEISRRLRSGEPALEPELLAEVSLGAEDLIDYAVRRQLWARNQLWPLIDDGASMVVIRGRIKHSEGGTTRDHINAEAIYSSIGRAAVAGASRLVLVACHVVNPDAYAAVHEAQTRFPIELIHAQELMRGIRLPGPISQEALEWP